MGEASPRGPPAGFMHDIWRSGFIRRPLAEVAASARLDPADITWLPDCGSFRFEADPFAVERDGTVTVFVEAYDHRVRRGEIHYRQHAPDGAEIGRGVALAQPFHLSYPHLIEEGGELFMLPEGYKGGGLDLYRCVRFPDRWERVARLMDLPVVDATVVRHAGRWWMFHALFGPADRDMRELHVAWSDSLAGPWTAHAANPVRTGVTGARPGGSAFVMDGALHLPVQDCGPTYGAAIELLRIEVLTPEAFEATPVRRFEPTGLLPDHADGLHTLSGLGGVTCIDVKSVRSSPVEGLIRTQYKLRRLLGLNGPKTGRAA